jgi:hypothetical protein
MVSENNARERYCPLAPIAIGMHDGPMMMAIQSWPGANFGGSAAPMRQYTCQASKCMMWRTIEAANVGYCGLAGRPDR